MAADICVRHLHPRDRAAWRRLWDGYNAFYGRAGDTALPEHVVDTTWDRFFDPAEPMAAFVADVEGVVAGIAHCLFHRSTIAIEPSCYLQDLFTDPQARGRGIAAALIEAVVAHARARRCARIYWMTRENNVTARRLYDRVARFSGSVVYLAEP